MENIHKGNEQIMMSGFKNTSHYYYCLNFKYKYREEFILYKKKTSISMSMYENCTNKSKKH